MEQEDADYAIAVDASPGVGLTFGQADEAPNEEQIDKEHAGRAEESLFLADGAEDEVGLLFRHVFELRLRALEESFSGKSARADGDLRLIDVVAGAAHVVVLSKEHFDARLLMGRQDVV